MKRERNVTVGNRLERLVWRFIIATVKDTLGEPERHTKPDPSIEETLTIQSDDSNWTFVWYEPNPNQKGSNPDFAVYRDDELLLAIECKNINPGRYHPSLKWIQDRVISRFKLHDAQTKLLYIPFFTPLPKDREEIFEALRAHGIKVVTLHRQIRERDPYGYGYVTRELGQYILDVLRKRK